MVTAQSGWCGAANKDLCMRCGRSSKNMKMQGTCKGPEWLREDSKHKLGRWVKSRLGGHDMVRRVDSSGEALKCCRKCSSYARQRLGPKFMNRCKPEKMDTKEGENMLRRILPLEEETFPSKNAEGWKIEGQKEGSPGRNVKGSVKSLRWEVSRRRKDCGVPPRRECWKTEEPCPGRPETCSVNTRPCTGGCRG